MNTGKNRFSAILVHFDYVMPRIRVTVVFADLKLCKTVEQCCKYHAVLEDGLIYTSLAEA